MKQDCCDVPRLEKEPLLEEQGAQSTLYLAIQGMNCHNCANRVRNALLSAAGVSSVNIDLPAGLGEVRFASGMATVDALLAAVRSAGGDGVHSYAARVIELQ